MTQAFLLTQQCVPKMVASAGGGAVVNVSSRAGGMVQTGFAAYGTAKAALCFLTRQLAAEFAPKVRVNCIMAGPFLTDISKAWNMEAFEKQAKLTIAMRRGGQPSEIVGAALYFASNASSYTTGAVLPVHGGEV